MIWGYESGWMRMYTYPLFSFLVILFEAFERVVNARDIYSGFELSY